jgi:hypothetical protein|eukprot:COSAG03_NODE_1802_length_3489_cov_9.689676_2_plen_52_part_00
MSQRAVFGCGHVAHTSLRYVEMRAKSASEAQKWAKAIEQNISLAQSELDDE